MTVPAPPPARDPGLQAERTALAWQRTGVSGVLVGTVAAVAAMHREDSPVSVAVAVAVLLCAAVAALVPSRAGASVWGRLVLSAVVPVALAGAGVLLAVR